MKPSRFVPIMFVMLIANVAVTAEEVTQSFTMDGRLYSDTAATTPLLDAASLQLQILNPAQTCILYEETQAVNTVATNGYYTIHVGQKKGGAKRSGGDANNFFSAVFSNTPASITGKLVADGTTACTYTPTVGDARYLRVTITPSDNVPRTTTTNMLIDAVPSALVAERAESLQGLGPADFVKITDLGVGANQVVQMTAGGKLPTADGSLLTALNPANLSAAVAITKGGTGQVTAIAGFNALSPATTKGDLIVHDGTNNIRVGVGTNNYVLTADSTAPSGMKWAAASGSSGDASYAAKGLVQFDTNAATSGITVASGVATVNAGTGANQIVKLDASSKLPAIDGSALINLTAASISGGTLSVARGGTGLSSLSNGRVLTTHNTTGAIQDTTCSQYQVISFDATGNWYCANVNTLSGSFINGGNSFAGTATLGTNDSNALAFETSGSTRMTILANGYVGVGVANPGALLDVNGTAHPLSYTHGLLAVSSNSAFGVDKGGTISLGGSYNGTSALNTFGIIGAFKENAISGDEAGYMAFATRTNGSLPAERMRITSTGRVGIGTSTPAYALQVSNATASNTIQNYSGTGDATFWGSGNRGVLALESSTGAADAKRKFIVSEAGALMFGKTNDAWSAETPQMTITNAGNVGIGTTSPWAVLDVQRSDESAYIRLINNNSSIARNPSIAAQNYMGAANSGFPRFELHNGRGNSSAPAVIEPGDSLGRIDFTGTNSTAYSSITGARVEAVARETFAATDAGTDLLFSTTPIGGAGPSERMRITEAGYVGIGTDAPAVKFEVVDGTVGVRSETRSPVVAVWSEDIDNYEPEINFIGTRPGGARPLNNHILGNLIWGSINGDSIAITGVTSENHSATGAGGFLAFRTVTNGTTVLTEKMRIENDGKVGIGQDEPRTALEVAGAIISTGSLSNPTNTINFLLGNIQHTALDCGAYILHNLKDGGTYQFIVKGTAVATCSFTAYDGAGTGALTVHLPPGHGATTNGKHTMYTIVVSGSDAYFNWTPGF